MELEVGSVIEGKITGITNFGLFVDIGEGKNGMVHISEVAQTYVNDIHEFFKVGDTVKAQVLKCSEDGKVSLSIKRAIEPKPRERKPFVPPKPDNSVVWMPKNHDGSSFEDMMAHFKQTSEEKMSDLKRKNADSRRPKRGSR